ncbi:MAG: type II/IV secretion system protein [Planctomycetota bacterium]|nr:MAG: type II/IV secretion system protein [Planctomycetota bacterium]
MPTDEPQGGLTGRLGKILVSRGVVTLEEVARALKERAGGERLGDALVRLGCATDRDVADALAEQTGLPVAELEGFEPEPGLLDLVPTRFVFGARLLPIERSNGTLKVATSDPFCVKELDELRLLVGLDVEPALAPRDLLEETIHRLYGVGADALDRAADEGVAAVGLDDAHGELEGDDDDAALIQFVNRLLLDALAARASDVHVEPTQRELKIRYRIDGVLHPAKLPRELKRFQAAIISRIKIMASLDIAEKRLPQDGRIRLKVNGRELDVRVSVVPTLHGEGVALRILDTAGQSAGITLADLGMAREDERLLRDFFHSPHGIVLVTGPTGSGKSTTLQAGLKEIDRETLKVITIEDPVEYRIEGASQIQVREKIGLTFARGLRHILRHDPDVVMVGEIRDTETAEIAVQAALTGHLVVSTLHTNDAAGAVARLVDMGVEPYLVAATVTGLMAQRLLRRVCAGCAVQAPPGAEARAQLAQLGLAELERIREGAGCDACRGQGYLGRTGIFEVLPVDDGLRELATQAASAVRLRRYARERGHRSLRDDGCRLVREGRTTPAEVLRVTRAE